MEKMTGEFPEFEGILSLVLGFPVITGTREINHYPGCRLDRTYVNLRVYNTHDGSVIYGLMVRKYHGQEWHGVYRDDEDPYGFFKPFAVWREIISWAMVHSGRQSTACPECGEKGKELAPKEQRLSHDWGECPICKTRIPLKEWDFAEKPSFLS